MTREGFRTGVSRVAASWFKFLATRTQDPTPSRRPVRVRLSRGSRSKSLSVPAASESCVHVRIGGSDDRPSGRRSPSHTGRSRRSVHRALTAPSPSGSRPDCPQPARPSLGAGPRYLLRVADARRRPLRGPAGIASGRAPGSSGGGSPAGRLDGSSIVAGWNPRQNPRQKRTESGRVSGLHPSRWTGRRAPRPDNGRRSLDSRNGKAGGTSGTPPAPVQARLGGVDPSWRAGPLASESMGPGLAWAARARPGGPSSPPTSAGPAPVPGAVRHGYDSAAWPGPRRSTS